MAESKTLGDQNWDDPFSRLVEHTVSSHRKDVLSDRSVTIADAVYKSVKLILDKVSDLEPRFTVSEILKVGSYFEGTKIDGPNEFDFLLVIGELSIPGTINVTMDPEPGMPIESNVSRIQGLVLVKLQDENMKMKWERYIVDDYLACFQQSKPYVERDLFGTFVLKVIKELAKSQNEWRNGSYNPRSDIEFFEDGLTLSPSVNDSSKVILKKAVIGHPNTVLELEYDGYAISVDLSPAIRYDGIKDCFKVEDCVDEALATSVIDRGTILLVAQRGSDFRVTFTETEKEYMHVKIDKIHKQIYMYLKYIKCVYANIRHGYQPFSSYVLKMFCIHHDIRCSTENKNISKCFDEVLDLMTEYCEKGGLPNVFNKTLIYLDIRDVEYEYRRCMLNVLKKVKRMDFMHPDDIDIQTRVMQCVQASATFIESTVKGQLREIKSNTTLKIN